MDWVQVAPILILSNVTPFNIFLLNAKFDKILYLIMCSYIVHACKNSKWFETNNYLIYK